MTFHDMINEFLRKFFGIYQEPARVKVELTEQERREQRRQAR